MGYQGSYGWHSLLHGRELLVKGMQISIGDGTQTLISDNWLPTIPPRSPRLLPYTNPTLPVSTLIDQSQWQWDLSALRDLVEHSDIALIQKIYLPITPTDDDVIWPYTPDGNFSVKSGYHFISDNHQPDVAPPPLATHPDLTKKIWSAKLPPKLKHFCWKMGSRILATKENLRQRHIFVDPICSRCCAMDETTDHLFFTCPYSQQVWRLTSCSGVLLDPNIDFIEKMKILFNFIDDERISQDQRYLPMWVLWRLWKSRNDLLFNSRVFTPEDVLDKSREEMHEWLNVTISEHEGSHRGPNPSPQHSWEPPPRGFVKCNFDVSLHINNEISGLGWIIRDHQGQFLYAGMGKFEGRTTIMEAELSALIWSIQSCFALGFHKVVFEGDNSEIIRYINKRIPSQRFRHFISTIEAWRVHFNAMSFNYVKRDSNTCADLLAKKAVLSNRPWCLYHTIPHFLHHNVYTNMN